MRIERKVSSIPKSLFIFILLAIVFQVSISWFESNKKKPLYKALEPALTQNTYQLLSLNSISLMAHMLTIKLQLHDNQQGQHISYKYLSYPMLSQWLVRLQALNNASEYSALLAVRVFSNTRDKKQLRIMLETVITLFESNPQNNWRWMAEGAVIAKYHLQDIELALTMAKTLSRLSKKHSIPSWARDLEFIMMEELNLLEAAMYVVEQSLLDKSQMHPDEKRFLEHRLLVLKQKMSKSRQK